MTDEFEESMHRVVQEAVKAAQSVVENGIYEWDTTLDYEITVVVRSRVYSWKHSVSSRFLELEDEEGGE